MERHGLIVSPSVPLRQESHWREKSGHRLPPAEAGDGAHDKEPRAGEMEQRGMFQRRRSERDDSFADYEAEELIEEGGDVREPSLHLDAWGIPEAVVENYRQRGLRDGKMYAWQAECLGQEGVPEGRNLVYTAPTSSGKSLVGDVLAFRRLSDSADKFALLAYPYVSLCEEREKELSALVAGTGAPFHFIPTLSLEFRPSYQGLLSLALNRRDQSARLLRVEGRKVAEKPVHPRLLVREGKLDTDSPHSRRAP